MYYIYGVSVPSLLIESTDSMINFAGVWLLIEGGSYLRVAYYYYGATPLGDVDTVDSFFS